MPKSLFNKIAGLFSYEFGVISKDTFFTKHVWVTASADGGMFYCGRNERELDQLFVTNSFHTIPESLLPFECVRSSH